MTQPLWTLCALSLSGTSQPRLAAIDLEIAPGNTAIIGPSGAGKTSLLNILVDFETPTAGTVDRAPQPTGDRLPLFWAPQDHGLWPHLSVREHLAAVQPPTAPPGRLSELLGAFDLESVADATPGRLSQGESARLNTARALASAAAVLVLDEPFAHIDPGRRPLFWERLRTLAAAQHSSLVFASHDPAAVLPVAEHAVCLAAGRLVWAGPVAELYWHPPTPALAACLGETNWFTPDEATAWLGVADTAPTHCRPEQLAVDPDPSSPLRVLGSRFCGAVAQLDLRCEKTGVERRVFHRPAHNGLAPGTRVVLRILSALILLTGLYGCGDDDEPALSFSRRTQWRLPADGPSLPAPRSLALGPDDTTYAVDSAGRIFALDPAGAVRQQWRTPDTTAGRPEGIAHLQDGRLALCDTHYHCVRFYSASGRQVGQFGELGTGPGQFTYPVAIAQDAAGFVYVAEYGGNDRVQKFTSGGDFVLAFGSFGTGADQLQRPAGLAIHADRVYVADAVNNRVQVFTTAGAFCGSLGRGAVSLRFPYDIALGPGPSLYVVEYGAGRLTRLDLDGALIGRYGSVGATTGQLRTPWGLAVTAEGIVRIADTGNRRLVEWQP